MGGEYFCNHKYNVILLYTILIFSYHLNSKGYFQWRFMTSSHCSSILMEECKGRGLGGGEYLCKSRYISTKFSDDLTFIFPLPVSKN